MSRAVKGLAKDEILIREKIAYGCGDLSSNLMWGMTSSYLMFFYTDIDGLPVTAVAWILLIARTFDAFCDPTIGWILDRKGGTVIPKIIGRLAVAFGVTGFLCFYAAPFSTQGRILWAGVTYIIFGAIYSVINTPYGALGTMMTRSLHDRVSLNAFRMMGCQSGQFIVSSLTIPAMMWLGGGTGMVQRQHGMALYAFTLAVIATVLWVMVSRNCCVRYPSPPSLQNPARSLRNIAANRSLWLCNGLVFLQFVGLAALYGFALYYARVVLGGTEKLGSVLLTTATVMSFFGATLSQYVTKRLGFLQTTLTAMLVQLLCYAMLLMTGWSQTSFLTLFALLTGAQGIMSPLYYVLLSSAIDEGRAATNESTTGLAYSLNTLVTKFSMGVTGFILAQLLSYGHYSGTLTTFPESTKQWISAGFVGLPLAATCLQICLILLWSRRNALHS
ncbi:MFS transporter [Acetobacter sp. KSO5]|uniref:MFS transporter n=1 Tax=Acetobacter sp. KSO5 TaxID=3373674 RepID=UPI00376ED679